MDRITRKLVTTKRRLIRARRIGTHKSNIFRRAGIGNYLFLKRERDFVTKELLEGGVSNSATRKVLGLDLGEPKGR